MALIKTSNEILSIRGRFGGVYFKGGPEGKHIQAMPRVWKYTRSAAQMGAWGSGSGFDSFGITGYSGASVFWLMALLGFYAAYWAAFAAMYLFSKEDKEPKKIHGFNWYIHFALAFPECERPPFWKPPHAPGELPNFVVTYRGTWTYEHTPDEWPDDSPADYYWAMWDWNGKLWYRSDNFLWHLWWKDPVWVLSPGAGFEPEEKTFYSPSPDIVDFYRNPVTKKWAHVYFGDPEEVDKPH